MVVSSVLIGVLALIVVPTLTWISAERRSAEQHQALVEEASNLMDRFTSRPWGEITPEQAAKLQLADELKRRTGAELQAEVETDAGDADDKRVALRIDWTDHAGRPAPTVRLTAWVYRPQAADNEELP